MDQATFITAILADPLPAVAQYYAHCLPVTDDIDQRIYNILGIDRATAIEHGIGVADRTLGTQLPVKQVRVGRETRQRLTQVGLYKPNGRETLRGCLTEPLRSAEGKVVGIRGWRLAHNGKDPHPILIGIDPADTLKEPTGKDSQTTEGPAQTQPLQAPPTTTATTKPHLFSFQANDPKPIPGPLSEDDLIIEANQLRFQQDDRHYRIRGLEKNTSSCQLKVNLLASRHDLTYVDTVDLLKARSRSNFIRAAATELYTDEELIKRDLGKLLCKLELRQAEYQRALLHPHERDVIISDEDRHTALAYLQQPLLLDRIVDDLTAQGIIGERTTKLVSYLSMLSRKLENPLALLIQSSSAAGKSSLMEAVLAMVPGEDQLRLSSLSGQSLYYWGAQALRHKILAISEDEGISQAAYALKLLQSEGRLRHATVTKGENGRMLTQQYTVEGPVSLLLTTTRARIDEELANRCLVLSVNESPSQTAAIHHRQRQLRTLEARRQASERHAVQQLHHNVQRLIEPLVVCNPHIEQVTFGTQRTRFRRDHAKFLTLIETIALLHQHQRPIHEQSIVQSDGSTADLRYIEVTRSDIDLAETLMAELMHRALDDLAPQVRSFLERLTETVAEQTAAGPYRFTRRWLSETLGYSDFQVRSYLASLIDQEYITIEKGKNGQRYEYALRIEA